MARPISPATIKALTAKIEKQERASAAKFEAQQQAKRLKLLAKVLGPLNAERNRLVDELEIRTKRIDAIDAQLSELTGSTLKTTPSLSTGKRRGRPKGSVNKTKSSGTRTRWTADELHKAGEAVHAKLKESGKELKRADLEAALPKKDDSIPDLKRVIEAWNEGSSKTHQILHNGKNKAASAYLVK